jgi:hypothetical protein
MRKGMKVALLAVALAVTALTAVAQAANYSAWAPAQKIDEIAGNSSELNTPFQDGCPIQSPNGLKLYLASTRPRFAGDTRTDLDIWVARRASTNAPWGAPVNLGEPVNSTADDFCPTPVRGRGLFFVSRKTTAESCGLGDIYFTRKRTGGWRDPKHLACAPEGPNSALDEQGPSYVETDQVLLYFSRSSASVPGDIYVSEKLADGSFGPASPVGELNSSGNDIQPNVRKDGLEIVLSSNRAGSLGNTQDIWVSTRASVGDLWSAPVNLGTAVNTAEAAESRPSLSWDAQTLLFGRSPGPEGSGDIYVSTRTRSGG